MPDALPAPPPAIVITGVALPEPKAEQVYATARIDRRQIEQSPTHELDQLRKTSPACSCFAVRMHGVGTLPARV